MLVVAIAGEDWWFCLFRMKDGRMQSLPPLVVLQLFNLLDKEVVGGGRRRRRRRRRRGGGGGSIIAFHYERDGGHRRTLLKLFLQIKRYY